MNCVPPDERAPVVLFLYNRPHHVRRVFEQIAAWEPARLYIFADGPKRQEDRARCDEARKVVSTVDWKCEQHLHFCDDNLGAGRRIPYGLNRVFERENRAIILEDDCLPAPTFFPYCDNLLSRFRDVERVMEVAGANFLPAAYQRSEGFYFSHYIHAPGWATWKRAWTKFDPLISRWPSLPRYRFLRRFHRPKEALYLLDVFNRVHAGAVDAWDYQWQFAMWLHDGLVAVPNANLVSNIGYDAAATNTREANSLAALPLGDLRAIGDTPPLCARTDLDQVEARNSPLVPWRAAIRGAVRAVLDRPRAR